MRSLKYLFSRQSQSTEWQDAVIARLDSLMESQNELRKELADHVAEGRPTERGRLRALTYLVITLIVISASVTTTMMSSTYHTEATTSFNQAQTAVEQVSKDIQPVLAVVSKHGPEYIYSHPNKAWLADTQAALGPARQYSQDNAEGNHFEFESIASEYLGETLLAVSSACFGAIAGWLLIPALVGRRPRRRSVRLFGGRVGAESDKSSV
jgi:hypothetical protein